jgi:hypothetical protein
MSLSYKLEGIKNFKQLCLRPDPEDETQELITGVTQTMIWLSIPCGYGEITAKNAKVVFTRIHTYETTFGAMRKQRVDGVSNDKFVTYQDVLNHIGLKTNVCNETETAFKKTIATRIMEDSIRSARRLIEAHESGEKNET